VSTLTYTKCEFSLLQKQITSGVRGYITVSCSFRQNLNILVIPT